MEPRAKQQHAILNYLFSLVIVAALIVIYLLTGHRPASTAADTPWPAASPTATPFGRPAYALAADLALYGIVAEPEGTGYALRPEGMDAAHTTGALTLSLHDGTAEGFVLSFPCVVQPDEDGSAISAALAERATAQRTEQAQAMEAVLHAVFRAFDVEGALPETTRSLWCARLLGLQNDSESASDQYGRFLFSTYVSGSGDTMRLCCSVLYEAA